MRHLFDFGIVSGTEKREWNNAPRHSKGRQSSRILDVVPLPHEKAEQRSPAQGRPPESHEHQARAPGCVRASPPPPHEKAEQRSPAQRRPPESHEHQDVVPPICTRTPKGALGGRNRKDRSFYRVGHGKGDGYAFFD